ncbi:MAG: hypothetical protein U9Q40_09940, partial [Campylobacterota bacterium]|nr:hypothetical protein [Campylobacterota bacterium]
NALGGQFKYTTSSYHGVKLGTTLMLTQPFLLPDSVESSTIGQDNGFRGEDPTDAYALFGELYFDYRDELFNLWYGRRVITTAMIGAKEARMLPSAVQGGEAKLFIGEDTQLSVTYIDYFKQRSSDEFTNIIKHALGEDTLAITGREEGYTLGATLEYRYKDLALQIHNLYASDFINTFYADIDYKSEQYKISAEVVSQNSVANADSNLAKDSSVTNGKKINSKAFGVRTQFNYKESGFDLVYRNILRDSDSYDSIITPWDGTLLYSYSSTTNNLGQSLYGKGLTSGGAYVGGTQGVKLGYTQKYDFSGFKGFKTHIAYANYQNELYRENQEDLKIIFFYNRGELSLQLKGIWIDNDTYTQKDGTVHQLDSLTQYHLIIGYDF